MRAQEVKDLIEKALPGALVEVEDQTGTGDHFGAVVVSPAFAGKMLVQRHQLVYGALGSLVGGPIHALALKTWTPEEAASRR